MAACVDMDDNVRKQIDDLELNKIWTDLDVDGKGNITAADMRAYKIFRPYDASNYVKQMDYDQDGEVTPAELAHHTFLHRVGREPNEAELRYATRMVRVNPIIFTRIPALAKKWKYYDKDNGGTISKNEISSVIARVYAHVEDEARDKMINDVAKELMGELDLNNDGKISKKEYLENELSHLLHRKPHKPEMEIGLETMEAIITK
ncbi:neo-calmodulin-like isoform X2 [Lineus longissimus]|uniref:neo-calmodulin-like isoform X2 n=1 Tax=Lineus longissimus TaxID=88925 RepID=UPI002B4CD578